MRSASVRSRRRGPPERSPSRAEGTPSSRTRADWRMRQIEFDCSPLVCHVARHRIAGRRKPHKALWGSAFRVDTGGIRAFAR